MNDLQLLLQAKKESIPALRNAREVMKQYFPNFGIKGVALENSPAADVLETTAIEGAHPKTIVSEFWDVLTQKSKGKVHSYAIDENYTRHELQEFGAKGEIENELSVSPKISLIVGKRHSYDAAGRKIQTVESEYIGRGMGSETITKFDDAGKTVFEDMRNFPPRPGYRERNTVVTKPDGSTIETQIFTPYEKDVSPYTLEITRANNHKITRLSDSRTLYDINERKSLVEVDPNTGNVTKLQLMGKVRGGCAHTRLEAEYNPENGACRSFRLIDDCRGEDVYRVKYDNNSNIIDAGGYSYECPEKTRIPYIVKDSERGGHKLIGYEYLDDSILRHLK